MCQENKKKKALVRPVRMRAPVVDLGHGCFMGGLIGYEIRAHGLLTHAVKQAKAEAVKVEAASDKATGEQRGIVPMRGSKTA